MSHLMSAQLGKCGVNPALRNSQENREIRENRKIPVHNEEKTAPDRSSSWNTELTENGSASSRNNCRSEPV